MKRVVMIAVIMAVITSLFAFSVYAAPTMGASYTTSISSDDDNITAYAYAVYEEGVYELSSQGNQVSLPSLNISIRIVNNTNKWVIKDTDQFKLRINGNTGVAQPFEFIDLVNCQITEISTSSGKVDISIKGDNSFVLEPNETYTLSFRFVNSAGFTSSPSLQFFNNQFVNTAYGIEELVTLPADELAYLSSLNNQLSYLIDTIEYDGNTNVTVNTNVYNYSYISETYNGVTIQVDRYIFNSYINYRDYELDSTSDIMLDNIDIVYPVLFKIRIDNPNSYEMLCNQQSISINGALPGVANYVLVHMYSNFAEIPWFHETAPNTVQVIFERVENGKGVLSPGSSFLYIYYERHISGNTVTNPSYGTMSLAYRTFTQFTDNTDTASDMNDQIHQQEQVWYDNNSQALEDVGLSNYRFSPSQSNGITQAVTQFQAVWNALGDWTNVYIFILILSISTYIIRHEPTTRVKQYRSSVQAERAERISYYGRKNAESRANSSSGSTLKNAIRRRK